MMKRFFSLLVIVAFLVMAAMPVLAQGPEPPSLEDLIKLQIKEAEKRSTERDTQIARSVTAAAKGSKERDTLTAKAVTGLAKATRDMDRKSGARDETMRLNDQVEKCIKFRLAAEVRPDYFNTDQFWADVKTRPGLEKWVREWQKAHPKDGQELSQLYTAVSMSFPTWSKTKEWIETRERCFLVPKKELDEDAIVSRAAERAASDVEEKLMPEVRKAKSTAENAAKDASEAKKGIKDAKEEARKSANEAATANGLVADATSLLEKSDFVTVERLEKENSELQAQIDRKADQADVFALKDRVGAVEQGLESLTDAVGYKLKGKDDEARVKIARSIKRQTCDYDVVLERLRKFQWKEDHICLGIYGASLEEGDSHLVAQMRLRAMGFEEKRIKKAAEEFGSELKLPENE